jgi:hypothetical protein
VTIDNTTPTEGDTLTASNSLVDEDGLGAITYTWKANGTTVGTGSSYTLTQAEVGMTIRVEASYTDGYGASEVVASGATAAVANLNNLPTGTVSIDNIAPQQGDTLTASNTLADADGLGAITYTWKADGTTVGTGNSYVLTQAEVPRRSPMSTTPPPASSASIIRPRLKAIRSRRATPWRTSMAWV